MGCTPSRLHTEDTVTLCKQRRHFIKQALHARHHLAAAHADYCRSLRLTGSALCSFAAGESLYVSQQTPAVFLHTPPSLPSHNAIPPPAPSPSLQPPPPPPAFSPSPSPSSHVRSSPSIKPASSRRRKPPKLKLPHILSDSSIASSSRSQKSYLNYEYPTAYQANSTTPSQASSVWNWEDFYPPSPPGSEFFDQRAQSQPQPQPQNYHQRPHHSDSVEDSTEKSEREFFQLKTNSLDSLK